VTETEALYRALIERIPAATYVDGPDGTPVYVSPQIEDLYGCSRDEWMRHTGVWQQRVHPEDRARVREAWEASLRDGTEFSDEYRILMPDGSQRWVQEHATPLRDEICARLKFLGDFETRVLPAQEDLQIARIAEKLAAA